MFFLQTTIGEIQTQMQENHEKNKHLSQENYDLATKLKKFIEQYEAREKVSYFFTEMDWRIAVSKESVGQENFDFRDKVENIDKTSTKLEKS